MTTLTAAKTDIASFPTGLFPEPVRSHILAASYSLSVDPSFIALPTLAALASAIGMTRTIKLGGHWHEPAVVWTLVIANSGTKKTPAQNQALEFMQDQEDEFRYAWKGEMKTYETEKHRYDLAITDWKRERRKNQEAKETEEPTALSKPTMRRLYTTTTDMEVLVELLAENPRGLLLKAYMANWFRSIRRPRKEHRNYRAMFTAGPLTVTGKPIRKWKRNRPRAAVSITGDIAPATLLEILGPRTLLANDLAARFLVSMPHIPRDVLRSDGVPQDLTASMKSLYTSLLALEPETSNAGLPTPVAVPLASEAARIWHEFHCDEDNLLGRPDPWLSPSIAYAARLSLIFGKTSAVCNWCIG